MKIFKKIRKGKNKKINKKKHNKTQTQQCICDTICPKIDENNRFNGLTLPLLHGWTIWYFSYLHIFFIIIGKKVFINLCLIIVNDHFNFYKIIIIIN